MFNNYFLSENRAVYEIMRKYIVESDRPQMTIWRMSILCWKPEASNAHSEYVILIAFPPQQLLNVRASVLLHTHIACYVSSFQLQIFIPFYMKY
jgi:hypothetical protein